MGLTKRFVLNPNEVLDALITVAGPGSGLDADLLDGEHAEDIKQFVSDNFIPLIQKGAPGGVAGLDDTGRVPVSQLPPRDFRVYKAGVSFENTLGGNFKPKDIQWSESLGLYIAMEEYQDGRPDSATGRIGKSLDGINWEVQILEEFVRLDVLCCGDGICVVTGYDHAGSTMAALFTSVDGENWVRQTSEVIELNAHRWMSMAYSEQLNMFVAIGQYDVICTSTDGVNWMEREAPAEGFAAEKVIAVNHDTIRFMLCGYANIAYISADGINWTDISTPALNGKEWLDCLHIGEENFLFFDWNASEIFAYIHGIGFIPQAIFTADALEPDIESPRITKLLASQGEIIIFLVGDIGNYTYLFIHKVSSGLGNPSRQEINLEVDGHGYAAEGVFYINNLVCFTTPNPGGSLYQLAFFVDERELTRIIGDIKSLLAAL